MVIQAGDLLFLDTNVLLGATDESRPCHQAASKLLALAGSKGVHLATSGQVLREYLVVATRPAGVNGLGMPTTDALENVRQLRRRMVFVDESEAVSARLLKFVEDNDLAGKRIHDANIVATCQVHQIQHLVTANQQDFDRWAALHLLATENCVELIEAL